MLIQDLRHAARTLRLQPGFTLVATICLALAIGLNTMMFSIVDGVLLEPLPFAEPDRLIQLFETNPQIGVNTSFHSYPNLRDWRDRSRSFSTLAGVQIRSLAIADRGEPDRYDGAAVSWNLFSMLGVAPALGRDFVPADDVPGAEPVVLLSDEVWRVRYASDPNIIGRPVFVNGKPHTIVGVMPPDFEFPVAQKIWIPLAPLAHEEPRDARGVRTIGRLVPGVTMEAALEELKAIAAALAQEYPDTNTGWSALARPLSYSFIPQQVRLMVLTMMGAVTLVLVIACANVANLMLARAASRRREVAVRAALGAGRLRLARQLLTEAILLALIATPLGLALAYGGNALVRGAIPPDSVPYTVRWDIDLAVVVYTMALAVATGVLFGLAPALQTARLDLQTTLREGGRGSSGVGPRAWLRSGLVVAEIALSLVLLIGASLFVRSFLNMRDADPGFDVTPLTTMRIYMAGEAYASAEARARRVEEILRDVEGLPGVEAAFASNWVPLSGGGGADRIIVEGRTSATEEAPFIGFTAVSAHTMRTLGVRVARGRDFTDAEGSSRQPVAIINAALAERFWPGEDPLGRSFRVADPQITETFTVIGIVDNIQHFAVDPEDEEPVHAYVPYPFAPTPNTGLTVRVRPGDPAAITAPVREAIRRIDAGIPLFSARSMQEVKQLGTWQFSLFGWMFSAFGLSALLLAVTGVYGLLAYSVSRRTQEIGVRVALGAARRDVIRLIVGQGLRLAAAGVVFGTIASFGVTRIVGSMLYNITPTDPVSFASVSVFLILVAILASYVPTRRATAVDPLIALRSE